MPAAERPAGAGDTGTGDTGAVFSVLADPTRRRLLTQLSAEGPLSATELSAHYPVSRQALVKHLSALSAAGLLTSERHGREVRYAVQAGHLSGASAWLADVGRRWDHRLEALDRQLRPKGPGRKV